MPKYELTADYRVVPVGGEKRKGGKCGCSGGEVLKIGGSMISAKDLEHALEAELKSSEKTGSLKGGFIFDFIVKGAKMIQNAIEHKPWNEGLGIPSKTEEVIEKVEVKAKPKRKVSDKMKRRNEAIKKIMAKTGMSLPEASRFLKENGF